jgi:hypothetical protein
MRNNSSLSRLAAERYAERILWAEARENFPTMQHLINEAVYGGRHAAWLCRLIPAELPYEKTKERVLDAVGDASGAPEIFQKPLAYVPVAAVDCVRSGFIRHRSWTSMHFVGDRMNFATLDREFSLFIRARSYWTCDRCGRDFEGAKELLHCSHFYSRRNKSVRFDSDNCDALCFECHDYFGLHKADYEGWKQIRLGWEKFDALRRRASVVCKLDSSLRGRIRSLIRSDATGCLAV